MKNNKFRIWDFDLKKFHYYEGVFGHKKPFTETSTFVQYESFPKFHRISEEQQFTGLKDKNGVEVFEGDIVEFADMGKFEVKTERDYYGFYESCFRNKIGKYAGWHQPEVIGNIHENPELLK